MNTWFILTTIVKAFLWRDRVLTKSCRTWLVVKINAPRRADYRNVALATEKNNLLHFCATCWVENVDVERKTSHLWSKVVEVVEYWKFFPKYKQLGNQESNKTYQVLLQNHAGPLVPLYFEFFETVTTKNWIDFFNKISNLFSWYLWEIKK